MKHIVSKELGKALDAAVKEFTLEGVLDVPRHFDKWTNECELLNNISAYELAKYIIEGYETQSLNFVSFHEAIEAYKNGSRIESYLDGEQVEYSPYSKYKDTISIEIREIIHGKWVILD